jgi:hypothetical protein
MIPLLPPLSVAEELPPDENGDPIPPNEREEGLEGNTWKLFFAYNWSCVSEITISDVSVKAAIIIVSGIAFGTIILLSYKLGIENYSRKMFKRFIYQTSLIKLQKNGSSRRLYDRFDSCLSVIAERGNLITEFVI